MRLYLDEDAMASALVEGLARRGFDVETAEQQNHRGWDDDAHLRYATAASRVLYSFNRRDYLRIHTAWMVAGRQHAGIILLGRPTSDTGHQPRGLLEVAERLGMGGMHNYLEFI